MTWLLGAPAKDLTVGDRQQNFGDAARNNNLELDIARLGRAIIEEPRSDQVSGRRTGFLERSRHSGEEPSFFAVDGGTQTERASQAIQVAMTATRVGGLVSGAGTRGADPTLATTTCETSAMRAWRQLMDEFGEHIVDCDDKVEGQEASSSHPLESAQKAKGWSESRIKPRTTHHAAAIQANQVQETLGPGRKERRTSQASRDLDLPTVSQSKKKKNLRPSRKNK